ncbi:hypothetical protein Tco_0809716, partial [Tanacetum coccineum]
YHGLAFVAGPCVLLSYGRARAAAHLRRELGAKADKPMVSPVVDKIAEPIVELEEQVIALVIDVEEDLAMLFGDENFSDDNFSDDDSDGFEDEEKVWEVNEE